MKSMTWFKPAICAFALVIAVLFRFFSAHAISARTNLKAICVSLETDPDALWAIVIRVPHHRTAKDSITVMAS